ncbi:MAG: SGNH/GDSL hydrolase family protein [Verrucomicrobiota bacterium]
MILAAPQILLGWVSIVLLLSWPAAAQPFDAIHVFGDSSTTTVGGPYFQGRWCNGLVWPEYLAEKWGLGNQARNNHAQSLATSLQILNQVTSLRGDSLETSLCVLFAGAWDFGPSFHQEPDAPALSRLTTQVVANCSNAVLTLYNKGARTIAVLNQPDFMRFPDFAQVSAVNKTFFRNRTIEFNRALTSAMSALRSSRPDLFVPVVDVFALFDSILDQPDFYGFTESRIAVIHDTRLTDKNFNGPGKNYLFWDASSITSKMQSMVANSVADTIQGTQLSLAPSESGFILSGLRLLVGKTYVVQSSSDAALWTDEQTEQVLFSEGELLSVSNAGPPAQFFRLQYLSD